MIWKFKMLIGSLVELHAWLHLYLCFSLLEKQFLSNLDTSSTPGNLSRFFSFSLSQSWYLLDNFSIHRESFCLLDSFSITVRSIEVCSIAARHLSISRDPLACIVFHMFLHISIILSSIASCFIIFMHLYWFLVPPWSFLIIFMFLRRNFIASCTLFQSWQKWGENVVSFKDSTC